MRSTLRKIVTTGLGAALMTEKGIRNQAMDYVSLAAQKGKDEFMRVILAELKKSLKGVDLQEEIRKMLKDLTIEVQATLKIHPSSKNYRSKFSIKSRG